MKDLLISLKLAVLTLLICCVVYPLIVLALAHFLDADKAEGSLVRDKTGKVIGSRLIAQEFTSPGYFWPRPSAVGFNGAAAGGSNLAPSHTELKTRAREIIGRLELEETNLVPADLLTTSGSGLDPHISLASARIQATRVAATRNVSIDSVNQEINAIAFAPGGRLIPDRIINVLELNLTLDQKLPPITP